MKRDKTQELKGVAILFMIWGHLFGNSSRVLSAYHPLIIFDEGGAPLVSILSRATGPVSFFIFLSGYGLYCANFKGDKHRFSRIVRLLLTYWVVILFILPIGLIIRPEMYDLSGCAMLENLVGLNPTYIPEAWFMLPYIILALTAAWEFKLLKNISSRYFLPLSFMLSLCTSFLLSRYGESYLYHNRILYVLFCWLHFQFPFLLGMASARRGGPEKLVSVMTGKIQNILRSTLYKLLPFCLFVLIALRCLTSSSAPHTIYVFIFILIWVHLRSPNYLNKLLMELGNRSMGMWFVHTSIGLYLFSSYFNSLKYPLLVFIAVTFVSWIVSSQSSKSQSSRAHIRITREIQPKRLSHES